MTRDDKRALIMFVFWVLRRLEEKGYVNVPMMTTAEGEAEYWEVIEDLRTRVGERPFSFMVHSVTGAPPEFCQNVAKMARHLHLIADSEESIIENLS